MKSLLVMFFAPMTLLFQTPTLANDGAEGGIIPVFRGDSGILGEIIGPKCLNCHASELSGGARNGAPDGVNFDTYESAKQFANRIIQRAVVQMDMPPNPSLVLDDEEKQALKNWMTLEFPESTMPPHFTMTSQTLELPEVFIFDANGDVTRKAVTEMQLIQPQPPFQFEITEIEIRSLDTDNTSQ